MKTIYNFSDILKFITESFDTDQWNVDDSSNDDISGGLQQAMRERVNAFREPDLICYYHFCGGKKRYNAKINAQTDDGIYLRIFNTNYGNKISFNKKIYDVVDYIILPDITPIATSRIYFNGHAEEELSGGKPRYLGYNSDKSFKDFERETKIWYRDIFEYDTEFHTSYDDLIQYCPDEILTVEIYFQKGAPKRQLHGNLLSFSYPPDMCKITGKFEVILRNAFNNSSGPNIDITIPSSVKKICTHAFNSNFGFMKYIYIPKSVTSIEKEAFDKTGLNYFYPSLREDISPWKRDLLDYCKRICKKLGLPEDRLINKQGLTITIPRKFEKRLDSIFNLHLNDGETIEDLFHLNKNIELNFI